MDSPYSDSAPIIQVYPRLRKNSKHVFYGITFIYFTNTTLYTENVDRVYQR